MIIMGTRPEVIKCAPVIEALRTRPANFKTTVVVTGQHQELLEQMLRQWTIKPDEHLNLMAARPAPDQLLAAALKGLGPLWPARRPHLIMVQGDTSTALAGALAGFYHRIPVAHLEAGLRTYQPMNPFPEEQHRRMISLLASWHFAPTNGARSHLLQEGVASPSILVTGNTVVDALYATVQKGFNVRPWTRGYEKYVVITFHRRESFGTEFRAMVQAIQDVARLTPEVGFVWPVHPNPHVLRAIKAVFKKPLKNLGLQAPMDYNVFVNLLAQARLVITDSGGVQEETTALGISTLICRHVTERPEAIAAGAILVPPNRAKIRTRALAILHQHRHRVPQACPFGDGRASERILAALLWISGQSGRRPRPFKG
jgi:UDP-N-acetylglucosamine 2-epimerase (non-hydrolysing)